MKRIGYYIAKIKSKIIHSHAPVLEFYKRGGENRKELPNMYISIDKRAFYDRDW